MFIQVIERLHQLAQRQLVVKAAGGGRDPVERVGLSFIRRQIPAVESGCVGGDGASAEIGDAMALVPPVSGPEYQAEVGDQAARVGHLDHELGASADD